MTVTIVETRAVTGGVDTHAATHMAAALEPIGGLLGVQEFPATASVGAAADYLSHWASTPRNYLEKIFQIPFDLMPMTSSGFALWGASPPGL